MFATSNNPDLIILDLGLPDKYGFHVPEFGWLHAIASLRMPPLCFMPVS